jgi:cytochrome c-type biogenesis protein CcmH
MTAFIVAALLLTAVVIALVTRPLHVEANDAGAHVRENLNATLLREEFVGLERDRDLGVLDEAAYTQARDDLSRRLLDETAPAAATAAAPQRPMRTFVLVVLLLPLAAGMLYAFRGTPQALLGQAQQAANGQSSSMASAESSGTPDPEVLKMVDKLRAKLKDKPDDAQGWAMLGRSYTVLGRYDDAVQAFDKIGPTLDANAAWLAEFADAAAMQAGGNPTGRPEQLAQRALHVDPDNALALMMASYAAAARTDFETAIPLIEHALKVIPADSEDHRFLEDLLAKSRERARGRVAGVPVAAATVEAPSPREAVSKSTTASSVPTALSLEIRLASALQDDARGKVLFLIARVPGERMPLAVIRRVPEAWPVHLVLDDSAVLSPGRSLSSVARVQVEARVSANGAASAAPGDLVAETELQTGQSGTAVLTIAHARP